ncbi:UDP-glucose/GDP-mannose dehydrogenase family protein [Bacillus pseudomycoides]|uniref:UDP-glucose dehydrogenase family protein n=1 Tax=Bacillus TaxID=1386 RepID=UPI00036D2EAA|nr:MULTISPECIES: UDP-glucose/GDP-mannose dehydrogenase family protein [Bacillus]MCX2827484.1 UDP-glucose/GDP-mannose dehydrogenase family protein [Bacillus sp. DHT2]MDR4917272.1 UDP-glucose/GDP-mannose dehydrogenase family protein [Bacillus pseudomycoides]MED4651459.1 UDP-glucose/GDP-mannose dehydrogenase family protein [Bacillus pseudomycoides]PDY00436.1 UDP-glucose/GDP-mannose dehydrogenase family protein [Bacillus pseudomycoides]PEE07656.1 UDP-glucose/GDP-mannose dehydrogenase family protei
MKITVIGTGYVGLITGVGLATLGHSVTCFDINQGKIAKMKQGEMPIYEPGLGQLVDAAVQEKRLAFTSSQTEAFKHSDFIFVAVGTPSLPDGTADLTYIRNSCYEIGMCANSDIIVVTKSTVPVGTNDQMKEWIQEKLQGRHMIHMVSNPEFLREGSGIHDFFHGDRIVIGAETEEIAQKVERLYSKLLIETFVTDIRSAEMIKYASNAFLATKISFINEISNICEKVGADVLEVAGGMGIDRRIGPHFLQAGIGYGGSCFPKDTNALVQIAGNVAHDFRLLKAVIEVNNKQQMLLVRKARSVMDMRGKQVAVLGAAFKPNTDDIREAPSLLIIKELLEMGANVIVYDPQAILHVQQLFGEEIKYTTDLDEAITEVDAAFIVTDWECIRTYPLERYVQLMGEPILFDGRNCYTGKDVEKHRMDYYSVGRKSIRNRKVSTVC